jgi:hypothetical protein
MLYDIQKSERNSAGIPRLVTDLTSGSKRRIFERCKDLQNRRQQFRVVPQYGAYLSADEINDMR